MLTVALRFATDCAATYRRADARTRGRYNALAFDGLVVPDGRIVEAQYAEPSGDGFALPEFEYEDSVTPTGLEPVTSRLQGGRCGTELVRLGSCPWRRRAATFTSGAIVPLLTSSELQETRQRSQTCPWPTSTFRLA